MKYILTSSSFYLINKYIENFAKKENISLNEIYFFDYEDNQFSDALSKFLSPALFEQKKIVLLKNANFLNKKNLNKNFETYFSTILNSENENHIFIQAEDLKTTETFYSKISPYFKLIELTPKNKKLNQFFIEKFLQEENIDFEKNALTELINSVNNNFEMIMSEISKLVLLDYKIDLHNVNDIVFDLKGESIFKLLESILKKNYKKIEEIFETINNKGINSITVLEILLNDLSLIIQIKIANYFKKYESKNELKMHPYRMNIINKQAQNYIFNNLIFLYKELLDFEISIKKNNPSLQEKLLFSKIISITKQI